MMSTWSTRHAALGSLVLVAVLAVLLPLAYASPPDPSWIGGLYDDDDGDDALLAITSAFTTFDAPELPVVWRPTVRGRAL